MADRAWIVPVHPPHIERLVTLLDGVQRHGIDVDVIAVATTDEEAELLVERLTSPTLPKVDILIAESEVAPGSMEHYVEIRSVINVKKFLGLVSLVDRYTHLSTLDAETIVLRPGDPGRSYALRAERKAWPAHRTDDDLLRRIANSPLRFFSPPAQGALEKATGAGSLYTWFEDVPTYEAGTLRQFFEFMGADRDIQAFCDRLRWADFDHIIYQYFCIAELGWNLVDLGWDAPTGPAQAWWEGWSVDRTEDRAMAAAFGRAWAPSWVCDPGLAVGDVPTAFLAFHRDRAGRDATDEG